MSSWPMLVLVVAIMFECGRQALLDRSPRKPFDWRRPDLEWWAHRRTRREVARNSIDITTPVMAPMVAGRHPFRRFWNGHLPTRRRSARTGR